jgi:hypothetical protein
LVRIKTSAPQNQCAAKVAGWGTANPFGGSQANGAKPMMDVVMIALGLAFFAVTVGYAIACDRL